MKKSRGFTLIEVMVAVVIVSILVSIALPSYRQYVIRGHRRAAQAAMAEIATRELQYFAAERTFADETALGYTLPPEVGDYYSYTIDTDAQRQRAVVHDQFHGHRHPGERRQPRPSRSEGVKTPAGQVVSGARPNMRAERGITLVEVLVTMVILAIGLLGLVGLQARVQVLQIESYQRAQALMLLNDMAGRIANNRNHAADYVTSTPLGTWHGDLSRHEHDQPARRRRERVVQCAAGRGRNLWRRQQCRHHGRRPGLRRGPRRRRLPGDRGLAGPGADLRARPTAWPAAWATTTAAPVRPASATSAGAS